MAFFDRMPNHLKSWMNINLTSELKWVILIRSFFKARKPSVSILSTLCWMFDPSELLILDSKLVKISVRFEAKWLLISSTLVSSSSNRRSTVYGKLARMFNELTVFINHLLMNHFERTRFEVFNFAEYFTQMFTCFNIFRSFKWNCKSDQVINVKDFKRGSKNLICYQGENFTAIHRNNTLPYWWRNKTPFERSYLPVRNNFVQGGWKNWPGKNWPGVGKIGHKKMPSNFESGRSLDVKNFTYATFDC